MIIFNIFKIKFKKGLFLFNVYLLACVYVGAPHMCKALWGQKRMPEPLELELQ